VVLGWGDACSPVPPPPPPPRPLLRACVTSYRTGPDDVRALAHALSAARDQVRGGGRVPLRSCEP
jgi:hypothetical protein